MKRGRHPQRLEGTHRCVEFEDDCDRVHSRTSGIDRRGHTSSSESKPLHGKAGWTLGSMWNPPDDSELSLDVDGSSYEDQMNAEVFESTIFHDTMEPQKAMRSKVSVTRHDGRGDAHQSLKCPNCIARNVEEEVQGEPEVWCKDCFLSDLVCTSCCVRRHRQNPFHRIEKVVKTCATFWLLELLHLFSLVSKTSTYHFYCTLERMTDNTGLNTPPSRKAALMRMLIQWCHLKLLKRGGRVHDITGPEGTKPGELAVLCPSCPRPGINLPPDWDQAPPHLKFLYILLICIDANFWLKNQIVSSYLRDPGLGIGWAYFTAREPYEEYIQSRATDADIGLCYTVTPLVPKFHEPGHKAEDHEQFSFNLAEGAALSDGECPERIWAPHNILGNSTKTAGPGTRQDLIDDHFGFWNWLKYCCMDLTEDEVHKELAEEEEAHRHNGGQVVHDMSPSAFMVFGLALEESQKLKANLTAHQDAHIAEQQSLLRSKIKKFEELRATYMPGLLQFITETQEVDYSSTGALAEEVRLWLPSCIPVDRRSQVCEASLSKMEERLRTAQCHDSLGSIRHILCLKMWMVEYKNKNVRGQQDRTRLRMGIDAIHERALAAAIKYRMAREAKMKLSGPGDWEEGLHKLEDGDIHSYQDPDHLRKGTGHRGTNEDSWEPGLVPELPEPGIDLYQDSREKHDGTGQTWRTLSWIWTTMKINLADGADENDDEVLCSEWCHSRARAHRAREEVLLLREEMRRTLRFLEWRGEWWMQRRDACELGGALREAVDAYALKQSDIQHQLAVKFRDLWLTALDDGRMENAPRSELHPSDDDDASSDGDRDELNIRIWSDEEEVELDEEDYADL
ncbi:uncharacterized protein EV420DRAFT_1616586 [Desarmillaria tabescens]|uniref:CxC2-like cysteine cluster KDZ transposase-associated domain-containing protein n=1 Tax=Armillaria tabescens TaxID=1929756 RepID=A0AA39NL74_ARMTA|nr:uncharacterized protein EV420DRAFT_1616586 [Desarmillaria tabescens]KAK0467694.1 hypothetical protein EV420DRAFT_1616586 [Desarmillaria tabescens]